eukprot:1205427-Rhodomonas_salina.2
MLVSRFWDAVGAVGSGRCASRMPGPRTPQAGSDELKLNDGDDDDGNNKTAAAAAGHGNGDGDVVVNAEEGGRDLEEDGGFDAIVERLPGVGPQLMSALFCNSSRRVTSLCVAAEVKARNETRNA